MRKRSATVPYIVGALIALFGLTLLVGGRYVIGSAFTLAGVAIGILWGRYFAQSG
jgi:hypothetical protein